MKSQSLQLYIFWHFTVILSLLCKQLCLLPFSSKGSVSLLFIQFSWAHGGDPMEVFSNLSLQIAVKCYFLGYFFILNFRLLLRLVNKSLQERHLQPSSMHVTKELEKQVNRMENLSRDIQKQKRKKRHKQIEFCNSIQD